MKRRAPWWVYLVLCVFTLAPVGGLAAALLLRNTNTGNEIGAFLRSPLFWLIIIALYVGQIARNTRRKP